MTFRHSLLLCASVRAAFAQAPQILIGSGGGGGGLSVTQYPGTMTRPPMPPQAPQQTGPPARLEGTVLNTATGTPLKGAMVTLFPAQATPGPVNPHSAATDAGGNFVFPEVPAGNYRLMAEKTGFVRGEYGSKGPMRPGTQIALASGQALKEITVRMQPHGVIAGRILDEDGEPLSNVQVSVLRPQFVQGRRQMMPMQGGMSNDLGEYRVFGLPPGKYILSATYRGGMAQGGVVARNTAGAPQEEGYATTYYPGATEIAGAAPLQPNPGQPLTNIDVRLQRIRTVRVKGRLVSPVNIPGRRMVMLMNQNDVMGGSRSMNSAEGPDGTFEIRGVAPGSYFLVAQMGDANGQYTARMPITVGNSNIEDVELVPRPAVSVSGQVRVEGDAKFSPSMAQVTLQPHENVGMFGGGGNAPVNADGTFTMTNVAPANYTVAVYVRAPSGYVKSVFAGDQELKDRVLTVGDGATPRLDILLSTASAKVSGQVSSDASSALQGAMVVLLPLPDKRGRLDNVRQAIVDAAGKFTLMSVPPGEYVAFAWDSVEPAVWMDPEFMERFEAKGKKIVLKENDNSTLDLELLMAEPTQ